MRMKVYTLKQVVVFFTAVICAFSAGAVWLDRLFYLTETEIAVAASSDNVFSMEAVKEEPDYSPEATQEAVSLELKIEVVKPSAPPVASKKILIYHTHTYEAFEPSELYPYTTPNKWRTSDNNYNIVRVGKELSQMLTALGYEVTHDTDAYEPPNLSTSYTRSLKMLEKRTKDGEAYDLYIDLHRDAYVESMKNNNTVNIAGANVAKLMMLIGKGSGQSFTEKPDWEKNYAIAQALTDNLNAQADGLCRRISLKTGRFNQHIAPHCVLIEVGNNKNTMDEVLASLPYLAEAIHNVLENLPESAV